MPSADQHKDKLTSATLLQYLKDPTFVEYFNSFLLLPAFCSRVFYNAETGYFEQVTGGGVGGWGEGEGEGGVMSSASQETLYLTDEAVGQSLDQQQGWSWVEQHRLPLFLRSDLYSEYKLCRLLSSPSPPTPHTLLPHTHTSTSRELRTPRTSKAKSDMGEVHVAEPYEDTCLPDISVPEGSISTITLSALSPVSTNRIPQRSSFTALPQVKDKDKQATNTNTPSANSLTSISASKSDIELARDRRSRSSVSLGGRSKAQHKRSLSVDLSSSGTCTSAPTSVSEFSRAEKFPQTGTKVEMVLEDYEFLGSKSGMGALWRFLRGKAGERNWLFWVDAERVKCYTQPLDQQRLFRELRERYLHAGAPLELPAEVRGRLGVHRTARLTPSLLEEIQHTLAEGLQQYWCPRFILHRRRQRELQLLPPHTPRPPLFRSLSTTPVTLTQDTTPSSHSHMHKLPSTITPSQTPTFRRIHVASSRPRSNSSPINYHQRINKNSTEMLESEDASKMQSKTAVQVTPATEGTSLRSEVTFDSPTDVQGVRMPLTEFDSQDTGPVSTRLASRKAWGSTCTNAEQNGTSEAKSDHIRKFSSPLPHKGRSSAAHYTQLARYTPHHLPDANSRCASTMASRGSTRMCDSRCQILSVSGTPLPPHSPTLLRRGDVYTPLLYCLATEHKKAGGYFQAHLEKLESRVYLHCLLFWRDVQDYKTLFVGPSFNPCSVEMKAKALYGRYIVETAGENIACPPYITSQVVANLWPAYEDLFDSAEEYVLIMLMEKWVELCSSEDRIFQQLEVVPVSRVPSARSAKRAPTAEGSRLQDLEEEASLYHYGYESNGIPSHFSPLPTPPHSHSPPKYPSRPPSSRFQLSTDSLRPPSVTLDLGSPFPPPPSATAISLNDIISNPSELEHFKVFLNEHYAAQDLMCWMEIETFRGIPATDRHIRDLKARQLRSKYFSKKYFFGPGSPANKEQQRQVVSAGGGVYGSRLPARPKTPVFREAQKHVRVRLEKRWLVMFIKTPDFIARNGGSSIHGRRTSRHSADPSKAYAFERSFINSREAIVFRRTLQERESRGPFQRYLSIKASFGTHPLQDIDFWLEVQRYKEMCHAHTTEQMLQDKVSAIMDCYFQSSVPPKLQLDIPQFVADQTTKKSLGPYVFREAQAAVFKQLYYHWQDYQNFTNGCNEEETVAAIDKLESQMREMKDAAAEMEVQERMEEDRKRFYMPRFETVQEKEERTRRERELAGFGQVAVAFRLSTPNPSYTYYTDLPEAFYSEEATPVIESHKLEEKEQEAHRNGMKMQRSLSSQAKGDSQNKRKGGKQGESKKVGKSCWEDTSLSRTRAKTPNTTKEIKSQITRKGDAETNCGSSQQPHLTVMKPPGRNDRHSPMPSSLEMPSEMNSHSKNGWKHSPSSHLRKESSARCSRSLSSPKQKHSLSLHSKFSPHTTISMRLSGSKGKTFAYGAGLPDLELSIEATS